MTREAPSSDPSYPISGTGPYAYLNPYREGALRVRIELDGILVTLDESAYTVDPVSSDTSGDVILSDAAAAAYDGGNLFISRSTAVEQGWIGQSAREVGLSAQLDWMVETIQDNAREVSRSLRSTTAIDPGVFEPFRTLIFDQAGKLVPGPTADEISLAQYYAEQSQKFAEGTAPGGPGTYSAREYSELLQSALLIPISHDELSVTLAVGSFALVSETTSPYDAIIIEVQ